MACKKCGKPQSNDQNLKQGRWVTYFTDKLGVINICPECWVLFLKLQEVVRDWFLASPDNVAPVEIVKK